MGVDEGGEDIVRISWVVPVFIFLVQLDILDLETISSIFIVIILEFHKVPLLVISHEYLHFFANRVEQVDTLLDLEQRSLDRADVAPVWVQVSLVCEHGLLTVLDDVKLLRLAIINSERQLVVTLQDAVHVDWIFFMDSAMSEFKEPHLPLSFVER